MFSVTETTKGKQCLLFDEYRYHRERIRNTTTYWRCERIGDCRGRVIQRGDDLPIVTSPHNHDPNKIRNEIEQFKTGLKKSIRETQTPIKKIYRSELIKRYSSSPDDVCELPMYHQIKNSLYRTKNENYPSVPESINEFVLEGKWRMSLDNQDFIIIDHHNPRFITFGTAQSLQDLCAADHLFMDGTFKSCPSVFGQLYTIHIDSSASNGTVPVLYSFLPKKTKSIYTLLFNELRTITLQHDLVLNLKFITIDFEKGAIAALKNVFPNSKIKGCNFHYNQCIFRKIQEIGLQQDYYNSSNDDPTSVKRLVQETGALAFMPIQEVNELWCKIMDKFEHIPRSQDFFDYFTETWIKNGCLFPRCLWNYYKFNGARTNNGCEGWHHRLNSNINSSNPNLYQVIDELKRDYAFNMATIKQLTSSTSKPRRNPKFVHRNQRIIDLMNRYEEGRLPLTEYFDKISQTIGKKSQ
ncbi:unnamed protein product [Rotaria sordida]|uniref:MULE transposase domain-containing protein n=1 Tax=Rotaria sordida TaxID=392033 RepID=A0A819EZU1_9BILA|nr:unnamed protein product [Rotaria sordida]